MNTSPRIAPLEPPYEPEIEATLAKWMPPDMELDPLRLFRTFMVHDELASRMRPLGAGILGESATVPPPLRAVGLQRTPALTGAEYEWGAHAAAFGTPLGLTDDQFHSTVHGTAADPCWDDEQSAVFELSDELHHTGTLSDELWERLAAHFDERQIFE